MATNKSLLDLFEELIPIFQMARIQIVERNRKIVLCYSDGATVILKKRTDENHIIFAGEGLYGSVKITISEDGKHFYSILETGLSFSKNGGIMTFSMEDANGLKNQIILSSTSFTCSKELIGGGNVMIWGSTEGMPLEEGNNYYMFRLKEDETISKVEVSSNANDTFIIAKGTIEEEDGEKRSIAPWVTDHKTQLEQWIYDFCYPYQGLSYFQDTIDVFENALPGITKLLASKYPFFGRISGKEYQDQSQDLLALCMSDLLAPLGLMKEETIEGRYLRLRNRNL